MKVIFGVLLSLTFFTAAAQESIGDKEARMRWFEEAKLGIFIHWGIYSVKGIDESWSFYNEYISYADYMKQLNGFTAKNYDPDRWLDLIKESGAKYVVFTSKHHDGVALWPSRHSDLNVEKKTPAKRDLLGPFCLAVRKRGLKLGIYFSLLDWSSENYPHFTKTKKRYDPKNNPSRWEQFLRFQRGQLREICRKYSPDLIWFDGDWDYDAEVWQAKNQREEIFKILPQVILNSRLNGYGDYATPEQGLPVCRPRERWWELCLTMNDSWGYQPHDLNYKTSNQIIRIFVDCLSMGGNLLLGIGPKEDGTIPPKQIHVLQELGRWMKKHQEAVYGVKAGIKCGHFYGPTTLSKKRDILFLYIIHKPNGPIVLKGIKNNINRIWVVGDGTKLTWEVKMKQYWSKIPGLVYIDVPERCLDKEVTVLAVLLDGEIDCYREFD